MMMNALLLSNGSQWQVLPCCVVRRLVAWRNEGGMSPWELPRSGVNA